MAGPLEATEAVTAALDEGQRHDMLMEVLLLGILPAELEKAKAQPPPANVLFEIGNDRSCKAVNLKHIKAYSNILIEVGKKFASKNIEVPDKVECRAALLALDTRHEGKLSHARTRKQKGQMVVSKADQHNWAKENGDSLGKLLTWFKKLKKSDKSYDKDVQRIKEFWGRADSDEDLHCGKRRPSIYVFLGRHPQGFCPHSAVNVWGFRVSNFRAFGGWPQGAWTRGS
jgi:hypothetical protein